MQRPVDNVKMRTDQEDPRPGAVSLAGGGKLTVRLKWKSICRAKVKCRHSGGKPQLSILAVFATVV